MSYTSQRKTRVQIRCYRSLLNTPVSNQTTSRPTITYDVTEKRHILCGSIIFKSYNDELVRKKSWRAVHAWHARIFQKRTLSQNKETCSSTIIACEPNGMFCVVCYRSSENDKHVNTAYTSISSSVYLATTVQQFLLLNETIFIRPYHAPKF
jgi:hypothetical protein